MHEVLVNRLGGLSLPRKSVVRLTDRPDMTLDVYRGRKTTIQQQQQHNRVIKPIITGGVLCIVGNIVFKVYGYTFSGSNSGTFISACFLSALKMDDM